MEGWATYVESYAYNYAATYLSAEQNSGSKTTSHISPEISTAPALSPTAIPQPASTAHVSQTSVGNLSSQEAAAYTRLSWLNRSVNLCIYSLLDVGIHYRGWTPAQAARFLKLFGIRDASVTAEIYRYITETPANYLKYYAGYLNFLDLKEEQQTLLGESFDLKAFHQQILAIGPVQFPVLRKYIGEAL